MSPMFNRVLGLLSAGLALGVAAELAWPDAPAPRPPAMPAVTAPARLNGPEPIAAWTEAILQRPVMNPDRRPERHDSGARPAAPIRPEPPRLAGIVLTPQARRAIFAPAAEGAPSIVVVEGARVEGWQVERIEAGSVHLAGPDGTRVVKPSFSNEPSAPSPAAAGALPQRPKPDLRPYAVMTQPSGPAIFKNAPPPVAARISQ